MTIVFCTIDITPEFWADFVKKSGKDWHLFRTPLEQLRAEYTEPNVEAFTNGFRGFSTSELEEFFLPYVEKIHDDESHSLHTKLWTGINPRVFVVIDERSKKDDSVLVEEHRMLASWESPIEEAEEVSPSFRPQWKRFRAPFDSVLGYTDCMQSIPGVIPDEAVLRMPGMTQEDIKPQQDVS